MISSSSGGYFFVPFQNSAIVEKKTFCMQKKAKGAMPTVAVSPEEVGFVENILEQLNNIKRDVPGYSFSLAGGSVSITNAIKEVSDNTVTGREIIHKLQMQE